MRRAKRAQTVRDRGRSGTFRAMRWSRARLALAIGAAVSLTAGAAEACPSCAAAGGESGATWLVGALIALPLGVFVATALAVRRLIARGRAS